MMRQSDEEAWLDAERFASKPFYGSNARRSVQLQE
jgi:hypothetical protein